MIYRGGGFGIAGAESGREIEGALEWVIGELSELEMGIDISKVKNTLETRYLVAKGDLGHSVDVVEVYNQDESNTLEYEPEQFPGLIFRDAATDGTALIFNSGKTMITGVGGLEAAEGIYDRIIDMISKGA